MSHNLAPSLQSLHHLHSPPEHLSSEALSAELVWRYIGDVLEGGHLHFFVSGGSHVVPATLAALRDFKADAYVPVLSDALVRWAAKPRQGRYSLGDLMDAVIAQEFADIDRRFFNSSPSWQVCLQTLHRELFRRELLLKERGPFGGLETR